MLTIVNTAMDRLDPLDKTDILVAATGSLSYNGAAILIAWGDTSTVIAGSVIGQTTGFLALLTRNPGSVAHLDVLASGMIFGGLQGVFLGAGSYDIDNAGLIQGAVAIETFGSNFDGFFNLRNTGVIKGDAVAVSLVTILDHKLDANITNYGQIFATGFAINGQDDDSSYTILNHGAIFGSIQTAGGADHITNRGTVEDGSILTGGGDDEVHNQKGRSDLNILLGAGDDAVWLGRAAETVVGGDGEDLVSYEFMAAVVVNLARPEGNRGAADGDALFDIEVLEGSNRGDDTLIGDAGANQLSGLRGDDRLSGSGGADWLEGGYGADVLTGGTGADRFVVSGVFFEADQITDFTRGAGAKGDKIAVLGAGFGDLESGLLAAGRFVARADNLAQDAGDRFIFRTGDTTLWFDADGVGGQAAILLADLQSGVTLTATDILVF